MPKKRKPLYDDCHKRFADYVIDENGKELIEYKVESTKKSIPLKNLRDQIEEAQKKLK